MPRHGAPSRKVPRAGERVRRSWFDECIVALIIALLCALLLQVRPSIHGVSYRLGALPVTQGALPLSFESSQVPDSLTATLTLRIADPLHVSHFVLRGDDCVTSLTINGRAVESTLLAPCRIDTPRQINLGPYLHAGDNTIEAGVRDTGGRMGLALTPSLRDPVLIVLRCALLLAWCIFALLLARRFPSKAARVCWLLFALGLVLRLVYADVTPVNTRGNDDDGHREYIEYMMDHWSVPPRGDGWQFYQPPLYYTVAAVVMSPLRAMGMEPPMILRILQGLSLAFSIGILGIGWRMARLLFSPRDSVARIAFFAILCLFPGYILLAPKLNNDALLHLLATMAIAGALLAWQRPSMTTALATAGILALAIVTKMNALPLSLAIACMIALHPALSLRQRALWLALGGLVILAMTEWIFVLRALEVDGHGGLVGNATSLNDGLRLTHTVWQSLAFDPIQVLRFPFNDAWQDAAGRNQFFAYFLRSSLFGEYTFASSLVPIAKALLFLSIFLVPLALLGCLVAVRSAWHTSGPLFLILCIVLAAHIAFRVAYPFSTSQDFRYSPHLLFPLAYGYAYLLTRATARARTLLFLGLGIFLFLATIFIGGVWITETAVPF